MQWTFATYGIYTTLNAIKQVASVTQVVMDTLCRIKYCIYGATHMQLYAISLQLISTSNSHTFQHGEWNANVVVHPFVNEWCMLIPFATYLQLFYN